MIPLAVFEPLLWQDASEAAPASQPEIAPNATAIIIPLASSIAPSQRLETAQLELWQRDAAA